MGKFAVALSFTVDAKDYDDAEKVAQQLGNCVVHEDELAEKYSIIDIEFLEDDDVLDDLGYDEDDS